jgi:hypothetical protein
LIGATATATEILKSLVLPGVGNFTIVDGKKITGEDIGNNFFLEKGTKYSTFHHSMFYKINSFQTLLVNPEALLPRDYYSNSIPKFVATVSTRVLIKFCAIDPISSIVLTSSLPPS